MEKDTIAAHESDSDSSCEFVDALEDVDIQPKGITNKNTPIPRKQTFDQGLGDGQSSPKKEEKESESDHLYKELEKKVNIEENVLGEQKHIQSNEDIGNKQPMSDNDSGALNANDNEYSCVENENNSNVNSEDCDNRGDSCTINHKESIPGCEITDSNSVENTSSKENIQKLEVEDNINDSDLKNTSVEENEDRLSPDRKGEAVENTEDVEAESTEDSEFEEEKEGDGENKEEDERKKKINIDEEVLKERDAQLTEEQKEEFKNNAQDLKTDGNTQFKEQQFEEAQKSYTEAIKICPLSYAKERSIMFANRGACYFKMEKHDEAIADCSKALELNPNYMKCIYRRAELYEKTEKLDEALADYQKIIELDPSQHAARMACLKLPDQITERNEKLKNEMMGKLKDLGNLVLKPFGLSTNNFKLQQDPNSGGYSVQFQQNQ